MQHLRLKILIPPPPRKKKILSFIGLEIHLHKISQDLKNISLCLFCSCLEDFYVYTRLIKNLGKDLSMFQNDRRARKDKKQTKKLQIYSLYKSLS